MSCLKKLNQLLKSQSFNGGTIDVSQLLDYAKNISRIENVTVVVSDMRCGISRIFPGKFGIVLGVSNYVEENSIWEKDILNLMTEKQREERCDSPDVLYLCRRFRNCYPCIMLVWPSHL